MCINIKTFKLDWCNNYYYHQIQQVINIFRYDNNCLLCMFYPLLLSYFFLFIYSFPTCSISLCLYSLVLSSVIHFSIFASFFYCSSLTFFLKRYYFYIFFSLLLLSILSLYVFSTFIILKLFSLLLWRIAKKAIQKQQCGKVRYQ